MNRPCVAKSFFSNKCYKLPYECSKFRRKITIDVDVILAYMKMRTKKLMLLLVLKMMLMKALA